MFYAYISFAFWSNGALLLNYKTIIKKNKEQTYTNSYSMTFNLILSQFSNNVVFKECNVLI
jgi:hypothetical protein